MKSSFEPFYLLKKFLRKIPKGAAIDIGAGNGHNSFFLAKNGFKVIAIDINPQKIKLIKDISEKSKLGINARRKDAKGFNFSKKKFNLILAIQSLNFVKNSEFQKVIIDIKNSLSKDGIAIISMFTKKDISFKKFKKSSTEIERNTFYNKKSGDLRFFLEKNELKKYFKNGFDILFYEEAIIKDKPHDEMLSPHKHGVAKIVVKKAGY